MYVCMCRGGFLFLTYHDTIPETNHVIHTGHKAEQPSMISVTIGSENV